MSEDYFGPIGEPEEGPELTFREKALRDQFVGEYLTDYSPLAAAIRIGYPKAYAKEMAARFMEEPYVLKKIREQESTSEDVSPDVMKKRIMAGLVREANDRGPGSSQAARVAALSKLAQMHGMDAPRRTEITGADGAPLGEGAFVVPGVITMEEWERAAEQQQAELVKPDAPSVH